MVSSKDRTIFGQGNAGQPKQLVFRAKNGRGARCRICGVVGVVAFRRNLSARDVELVIVATQIYLLDFLFTAYGNSGKSLGLARDQNTFTAKYVCFALLLLLLLSFSLIVIVC